MRHITRLSSIIGAILLVTAPFRGTYAAIASFPNISLREVRPIYIAINPLPKWVEDNGVTRDDLRTWIESQFTKNGIEFSHTQTRTGAAFTVVIDGSEAVDTRYAKPTPFYTYVRNVSVYQNVRLFHGNREIEAATWGLMTGGAGTPASKVTNDVLENFRAATQAFIVDYKAANPQ